jgi:hypothetical protein
METQMLDSTVTHVEGANKSESSEMIERWQIPNSPFTVISIENKHFGVMGEYRITEECKSRGEVEDELKCITWNRIIQVMMILEEIKKKDKEFNKKVENKLKTKKTKK